MEELNKEFGKFMHGALSNKTGQTYNKEMHQLKTVLEKITKQRLPHKLDQKMRTRKELAAESRKKFNKPYHLAIIELNQGLMPGYPRMTQKEIAALFQPDQDNLYSGKMISNDIRRAASNFEIKDLMRNNVAIIKKNGEKHITVVGEKQEKHGCIICGKEFESTADCLLGHRKCFGLPKPPSGIKRCLKCQKEFRQTPTNWHVCTDCTAVNLRQGETSYRAHV